MKIHLISDTHIEGGSFNIPIVEGNICILAGDICTIKKDKQFFNILTDLNHQFQHVILVLGNHEFYHSNYKKALTKIKQIADETKTHLLDIHFGTENLEIEGLKFWGSTLWTDFNKDNFFIKMKIKKGLNDSRLINGLNVNKMYDIHVETIKKINWNADIIISHHMPIIRPHSTYGIGDLTYGFCCSDLEYQIEDSNVKYWFYGHTHDNTQNMIGETQVVCNQMGYRDFNIYPPYDPYFLITM